MRTICHLGHIWERMTTGAKEAEMSGKGGREGEVKTAHTGRGTGASSGPPRVAGRSTCARVCVRMRVCVLARGTPTFPPALSAAFLCPVFALARAENRGPCLPTLPVPLVQV